MIAAWPTTIRAAAAALREGTCSSRELTERSLEVIDRLGPATNAFIRVTADTARRAAAAADEELRRGLDRGPLQGIPISLKDLIDVAGEPTTAASRVLADNLATADAPVVVRLRHAGAVLIGRTNLHEFALGTTSEDSAWGPVRHPADHTRSAGGSSGGSAVAVATGMGLASVGTDTGGSIRIPAAACGIVGLKPGAGEVPIAGVVPLSRTLDHVGPLARSVHDAGILWSVLADAPVPRFAASLSGRLLGRLGGYFEERLQPGVRQVFDAGVRRLSDAGARISPVELPEVAGVADAYVALVLSEGAYWHGDRLDRCAEDYQPAVRARLLDGRHVLAVDYLKAHETARRLGQEVDRALETCDALIVPTLPLVAPPIGVSDVAIDQDDGGARMPVRAAMLRLTQPFNLSGHPAISLPLPTSGLPVGLQVVGRRHRTADLLALAAACEEALADAGDGRS